MRPTELMDMLAVTIEHKLPVLIKGAPGCGKSDIVGSAADRADAELVLMHPVVSDPTDFKGLPAVVDGKADFLPFGDLKQLIDADEPTVAFLDDLGQAPAVVQAAAMQLILARRVNGHKISKHVTFIAATNRREDRAGVTGILEPVKSRFCSIVELQVNTDDWTAWAIKNDVPAELIAFLRWKPQLLTEPGVATNDIVNRPSPRTVTQMGKLFAAGITGHEALSGACGEGFATEFVAFQRIWQSLPNIDNILLNPDKAPIPPKSEPAALYSVATALAVRATKDSASRVIRYLDRLPAEYGVLGIRDMGNKTPEICNTTAYIKWMTDHQDLII